jgi:EAL domain-containing protein (putative c-di-GMP-specific phosphodiesterase class I)
VDRIKIAREFVSQVTPAGGGAAIVRATIGLANELGIAVLAEGVESLDQLTLLQAWGCQEVQGFYFPSHLRLRKLNLSQVRAFPICDTAPALPASQPLQLCRASQV